MFSLTREVQTLAMPPKMAADAGRLLARSGNGSSLSAGAAGAAVAALSRQSLVRLMNVWTNEEIIFNGLRSRRPNFDGGPETAKIQKRKFDAIMAEAETTPCDFCHFKQKTAFDGGGRGRGGESSSKRNDDTVDSHSCDF